MLRGWGTLRYCNVFQSGKDGSRTSLCHYPTCNRRLPVLCSFEMLLENPGEEISVQSNYDFWKSCSIWANRSYRYFAPFCSTLICCFPHSLCSVQPVLQQIHQHLSKCSLFGILDSANPMLIESKPHVTSTTEREREQVCGEKDLSVCTI